MASSEIIHSFSAIPVKVRGGYSDVSVHVQRGKEELGKQNASRQGLWTLKPPNNGCALADQQLKHPEGAELVATLHKKKGIFFFIKKNEKERKDTQKIHTHRQMLKQLRKTKSSEAASLWEGKKNKNKGGVT